MTNEAELTTGVLKGILSKTERSQFIGKPFTVQVTNSKVIDAGGGQVRFRVLINDGKYSMHGVITDSVVPYLNENGFTKSSIITVKSWDLAKTAKRILVISDLELKQQSSSKIDTPMVLLDTYFAEHPEEDYLAEATTGGSDTREFSPAPGAQAQAQQQQQQLSASFGGNEVRPKSSRQTNPIELLSPYQNSWTIKARVSYRGDLRTWQNARGLGKLFNVNFLDESDEIRATAFNDVAEKMYQVLQEGKVYYISKARIQQAKPQFSRLSHPYELNLDRDTIVEECFDSAADVPQLHFNFTKLNQIQKLEPNSFIDVIGVIREVKPAFQITAKSTGKPFDRRDISIVDDTNFAISVGLWNSTAIDFNMNEGSVIALKGCKVQDFGGRSLTLTQTGSILANPDTPESYQLKGWYDNHGLNENFKTLKVESGGNTNYIQNRKTILQAQEENLGINERPDFFSIKATINFFKTDTFCYPACTNKPSSGSQQFSNTCNRKVTDQSDGTWRCEKCDINFNEPHYRYIINCSVMDATGQLWSTLFDAEASKLLGVEAGELLRLRDEDNEGFKAIIDKITMQEFNFRLKARQDTYNGTVRIRYQTMSMNDIDYEAECDHLCSELGAMFN